MIRVVLNGREREVAGPTVTDLLTELGLEAAWTIVEHNRAPLARDAYATTTLREGDRLEIVRAVAGG